MRAERLANCHLHLEATQQMLPYIAASGHDNYLKSVHLYLQKMSVLPEEHPEVYQSFLDGLQRDLNGSGLNFQPISLLSKCSSGASEHQGV